MPRYERKAKKIEGNITKYRKPGELKKSTQGSQTTTVTKRRKKLVNGSNFKVEKIKEIKSNGPTTKSKTRIKYTKSGKLKTRVRNR